MNLLILPGAGDPFHQSSILATNLLIEYAQKRGFNKIHCISYPGHKSYKSDLNLELEINSTKDEIIKQLNIMESLNHTFLVFVRSYGCNPYLDILANASLVYKNLRKSIVWGSSAYHFIYQGATELFNMFYKEGLKRGVKMSKDIFQNTFPIENYVQVENSYKCVFCSGSLDKYSPQFFYGYLIKLNKNTNNSFHPLIDGEKHTIYKHNEDYEKLIFD